LGQHCPAGTVLLLSGPLGSGKTSLVQGIGAGLGITDAVSSPTFTLVNEYLEGRIPLYHVDLYRLDPAEVDQLNLDLYWDDWETTPGLVAIEWSERLRLPPPQALAISLAYGPGEGRRATLAAQTNSHLTLLETAIPHALLVDEV
jgi:tRNA threonylcarbamoyladenosine biosynthesis protein TsaE